MALSFAQHQQFKIDGYLVLPKLLSSKQCDELAKLTKAHLHDRVAPFELEAQVQYPGAPVSQSSTGGDTIRRLKLAYQRDALFAEHAANASILESIRQILGSDELCLNPNHHNCIMTKQPEFSSETLWHRDTRYWQFSDKYLVNAWFAIGDERQENGAMKILPGSHRWEVRDQALDEAQFLKLEHPDNSYRLKTQRLVELSKGDVLLFSAHCFHAAGKNRTQNAKFSMVFTYHDSGTKALANTPSSRLEPVKLS